MSRIGIKPIDLPSGVKAKIEGTKVDLEGSKGKLSYTFSPRVKIELKEKRIIVGRQSDSKIDKSLHGLTRALIANMVKGVSEGYQKSLEIIGVGFKAQLKGKTLNLQLGFSHPVDFDIPEGITIEAPKPTQVVVKGIDKALVGQIAASIRAVFPPEPYKGKGIRYAGEYVKKKVGKAITK